MMELVARDLHKSFGSVEALAGVSFQIAPGTKVALIGPNGSGKSTLIRAILGIVSYRGDVFLDGASPLRHRVQLARRMAYVPQVAPQMRSTVGEIVRLVCRVRKLDRHAITGVMASLDLDLDEIADRPMRGLSGGMKQKFLIALALAAPADLLILDEPTASLDAQNRGRFFQHFTERAKQATVLLCSHRLEEIEHMVDQVVELKAGQVVFDGPVATFLGSRSWSLLEIQASNGAHTEWLLGHGFSRGTRGIWVKTVSRQEKMSLLGQIASRFDGNMNNVVVRDLETIEEA